ncbi:MAG: GNAT family N-acetyltransferase [Candidatus Bathyarchaeia archaeon]|jgi:predicted GNAT family N-acyltransferase
MSDKIKPPIQCTKKEIEAFFQLLKIGSEVEMRSAHEGIMRAKFLAFHYEKESLAGIAALKKPTENYKRGIFLKAKTTEQEDNFDLELGYVVTLERYRGFGICSTLVRQLIERSQDSMYATTRTTNMAMQTVLQQNGFSKAGVPYKGKLQRVKKADYFLQLFIRNA